MRIIWDLWDNIKSTNTHIIWVPEGEEKEEGSENIFEDIIAEKFPDLWKETFTQFQEAQSHTHWGTGIAWSGYNSILNSFHLHNRRGLKLALSRRTH